MTSCILCCQRCVSVCHIGSNLSGVYRMQLAPGHYVFVQTKSKLFKNSASGHPEFIMSTHSIVRCVMCKWQIARKFSVVWPMKKTGTSFWIGGRGCRLVSCAVTKAVWEKNCSFAILEEFFWIWQIFQRIIAICWPQITFNTVCACLLHTWVFMCTSAWMMLSFTT